MAAQAERTVRRPRLWYVKVPSPYWRVRLSTFGLPPGLHFGLHLHIHAFGTLHTWAVFV